MLACVFVRFICVDGFVYSKKKKNIRRVVCVCVHVWLWKYGKDFGGAQVSTKKWQHQRFVENSRDTLWDSFTNLVGEIKNDMIETGPCECARNKVRIIIISLCKWEKESIVLLFGFHHNSLNSIYFHSNSGETKRTNKFDMKIKSENDINTKSQFWSDPFNTAIQFFFHFIYSHCCCWLSRKRKIKIACNTGYRYEPENCIVWKEREREREWIIDFFLSQL